MTALDGVGVVLGDRSVFFAEGLAKVLESSGTVHVLARATEPDEIPELVSLHEPDVVLASFEPPSASIELARRLPTTTIVLTWSSREDDVIDAMRAGAKGYVHKDVSPDDLIRTVADVAVGRSVFPSGWERVLVARLEGQMSSGWRRNDAVRLTAREREIVQLVVEGYSNKHMALALGIAHQTAKNHLRHVMAKVGVTSRVQLCSWAIERGYAANRLAATS